ncbi:MAG: metallophosphoesterase [Clostridia bacterium]|nr:metallophosphoesterase [Clostridia bacterium]
MKILVLSDSHGNISNMERAVEQTAPRMIFHLGDCWRDAEALHQRFPHIPLEQVPGNCDFRPDFPAEKLLFCEDKRILLCHGHTYGVKNSLLAAGYAAEEQNLDLFLFGHTHRPLIDRRGKTWFVNPGSIGDYRSPTYAIVTILNGQINARTVLLNVE